MENSRIAPNAFFIFILAHSRYAYGEGMRLGDNLGPIFSDLAKKIRAFGQLQRWQINARVAGISGQ